VPPGGGSIPHIHHREDEGFYILEGEITVFANSESVTVGPGSFVNIPRHSLHYFKNLGSTVAKLLILYGPAGFEHVFFETSAEVNSLTDPPPPITEEGGRRFVEVAAFYGTEVSPPTFASMGGTSMTDKAKVPAAVSAAIISNDWDAVRAGMADDIIYKPGSSPEIHGADETVKTLKKFFSEVAVFTGHKVRQIWEADGVDGVAIEMDAYYRRIRDGKDLVITCTDIYRLKGDRIGEWRVNADISPLFLG
jgi:limonene-1,2-epoxide hydrolase